jgi:hypothetical protein
MYPSSGATIRADINAKVEEAAVLDRTFIGPLIMPALPVEAKSGQYPKIQIAGGELASSMAVERSRGSAYGEVSRNWTTDTYDCIDRGLEEAIDDADQKDIARFFNLEVATAQWLRRNVQLAHETRVQAAIFNTTNFGAATNSTVAYTSGNLATIDFPADVIAAVERVADNGVVPNTIVMGPQVMARLLLTTKLQTWVRGSLKGQVDLPMSAANLASAFGDLGISQVLVGRTRYNAGKKGAAKSMTPVWGSGYIWVGYVNGGARIAQDGGAGFTLYWSAEGGLFTTETYRNDSRRANMIRVRQNTAEKIVDGTAGTLINPQYS